MRASRRDDRQHHRGPNKFPAGALRDRFVRRNIFGALDSFRRDLKCPGKKERDWETENYEQHHEADCPIWNFEKRKDLGRDLNEEPGHDRVSDRDLVDIASFKFSEEITRIHPGRRLANGLCL
jgi:hypothetical protein